MTEKRTWHKLTDEEIVDKMKSDEIDKYLTLEYKKEANEQMYRLKKICFEEYIRNRSLFQNKQDNMIIQTRERLHNYKRYDKYRI